MRLNKEQQKRIKRAVRLAEWNCRQKRGIASNNNKMPENSVRAVIWRG